MAVTTGTAVLVGRGTVGAAPTVKYTTLDTKRDLEYELNRLAKTLDALGRPKLAAQAAANVWAGTGSTRDMLAALNVKAGITIPKNYLGLNGVCNLLASTSNLDPVSALRTIATPA
jgi:hypothetical protein